MQVAEIAAYKNKMRIIHDILFGIFVLVKSQ